MEKRVMFRWHACHDLDLLREVVSVQPNSASEWNSIAANLQHAWGDALKSPLKGRSCKEHFEVLLAHHKAGNSAALKKSGTEEQYGELEQLLDDVMSYLNDMQKENMKVQARKQLKLEQDRQQADMCRDAAMVSMKEKRTTTSDSDEDGEETQTADQNKKGRKKIKRTNRSDLMTYLSEKSESNVMLKQQELDYKNKALEIESKLKQDAMALEQKKLELQEKQIAMQFDMLKAFMSSFKKQD